MTSIDIQITSRNHAATLFKLPAISPTVTAWDIKEWKIKEGQCYSAGDVLLEIENNKIPVEVKAQDNGTLASIWKNDGSQNIQVGEVIGVLAENGDDIPSLEILEKGKSSSRESRSIEKPLFSQSDPTENISEPPNPVLSKPRADNAFVHSPAVMHLLREYSITDPSRIIATGPNGRILKGDVLAHIGKINESTPKSLTDAFCKLSKLDLRNIKAVEPNLIKSTVTREKAEGTRNDTNKTAFEKSILKIIDVEIDLSKVEKLAEKISGMHLLEY
ncbi:putative pyruvate dehydrogenase protein X component, mitochondrial [Neolecta irregularis DAH-3]|uniref:Putative pyruvate dehydrogenase protein X component, mitochondrial n=1 Tax=Neolecta irregularis (strain DAH-3) TaxID=1198029 RepID=A0A1U7LP64_NEOID|nr:putative pyruvate dehydrogenase protein X component, mitochondrial [Neolecta irregularis DAH-3]|eukprot:OLL24460.1 putative pyruvate dehydrogenase protein X component, mitochondrial [Neolecta irregularis DAH-3]